MDRILYNLFEDYQGSTLLHWGEYDYFHLRLYICFNIAVVIKKGFRCRNKITVPLLNVNSSIPQQRIIFVKLPVCSVIRFYFHMKKFKF